MQKNNERLIYYFDVSLNATFFSPKAGNVTLTSMPLKDLVDLLISQNKKNRVLRSNRAATETSYISDIELSPDKKSCAILINRSDKSAADVVFSNPVKNIRKNVDKELDEGSDFSAHLLLWLDVQKNGTYLAYLEVCPGFPSVKIEKFLNDASHQCLIDNPKPFLREHPDGSIEKDGKPKMVKVRQRFEFRGHPSKDLLSELNNGHLESIDIIDPEYKNNIWDTEGYIVEHEKVVHLKPSPKDMKMKVFEVLKSVCTQAHTKHYELARIKYRTKDDLPRTVTLETESMQLADDMKFIRKEKISGFKVKLRTSFEKLNPEVVEKMIKLPK